MLNRLIYTGISNIYGWQMRWTRHVASTNIICMTTVNEKWIKRCVIQLTGIETRAINNFRYDLKVLRKPPPGVWCRVMN